jgi:hypothetical protein
MERGILIEGDQGNWNALNEKMQDELQVETALALATVHGPPREK